MPASTWRLAGVSSTIRMLAGCPAPLSGFSGFIAGSCCGTVEDRTTPRSAPGEPGAREMTRAIQDPVAPAHPGQGRPLCRQGSTGFYWGRAPGGRVPLPQGDSVAFLVVFDLIHE